VLQIVPLMVLGMLAYALFMPSLFLGHWLFGVQQVPLWALPVYSTALAVVAFTSFVLVTVLWKWILLGRQRPGTHAIWSWYYLRWW
jgi:cytochrome bd-type quinol oxidase subunit 1